MEQSKRCPGCGLVKVAEEFSKRTNRPSRHTRCKQCVRNYSNERYRRLGHDAQRAQDYYVRNRDRLKAYAAQWAKANPGKRRDQKNRRRAGLGDSPRISPEKIAERFAFFGGKCWMCGADGSTVDHVKPLSKGGLHLLANLRPACLSCNSAKRDKWYGVSELHHFIR